jgi:hypothetical protein
MYDVIYSTRVFIEKYSLSKEIIVKTSFENKVERISYELSRIDQLLEKINLVTNYYKRLIQGPFLDILTHIRQIAMLQRLVDYPIDEDFSRSEIKTGIND